ncbi:unnamed protein product [Rotaria sordida]|uniref:Ribosomal protein L23 n=1 Tax=Rotaria sordida TaxID=392033 RepID=A0A819KMG7_9BILA|nr:unnamed protein product [Rotaria sordida]
MNTYSRRSVPKRNHLDHFATIKYPSTIESAMKKIEDNNTLVSIVNIRANKPMINQAVKKMYDVDAEKVNTLIRPDGEKKAYVRLKADHDALDVANRIVCQSTAMDKTVLEEIQKDYEHYVGDPIDDIPAKTRIFLYIVSSIMIILMTTMRALKSIINPNCIHLTYEAQRCVNKRLNTIVRDPIFTSHLTLMRCLLDDSICPLPDSMLDRFCSQILPEIHCQIKWLDLESSSMERILRAANYPNLSGLGLLDIDLETAQSLFVDEYSLIHTYKNQITSFVIDITKNKKEISIGVNIFLFTHIFITYTNLQYLNFNPLSSYNKSLSFPTSSPTFISSNLLELYVSLKNFIDCLYILDGRFNQLRTFHVNISHISVFGRKVNNKEKLPNLRCFSLHSYIFTNAYDELIIPLLYRMSNLEKLDLNLSLSMKKAFVDGNDLKKNIINHMLRLDKFTFNICSVLHLDNEINLPSNEDIQNTFHDFKNSHIISCLDYFQEQQSSQCLIYSYPYRSKFYKYITNNFSGGLFKCVREISLFDVHPFEHEFFLRISQSFPFMQKLALRNYKPQNNKLCKESKNDNQDLSIIKYPHLTNLTLSRSHDDYVEQFLLDTKTCLPNNVHLNVTYQTLERVTHNFTRDATRINCQKLKSLSINPIRIFKHVKNYFPHTEIF